MPSGWASGRVAFEQSPGCSRRRIVALWERVVQVDKDTDRDGACGVCQGVTQSPASLQCNKGGGEYWEMRSDRELGTIAFITLKAKVNLEFSDLPMFCPLLWVASA